jgi:hypothetical protein
LLSWLVEAGKALRTDAYHFVLDDFALRRRNTLEAADRFTLKVEYLLVLVGQQELYRAYARLD